MNKKIPKVISLGGSLLSKNGKTDLRFLREFKKMVLSFIKRDESFVVVVGGGELCRDYQNIARSVGSKSPRDLDWIGIYATRLNAAVFKGLFSEYTTDDLSYGNFKRHMRLHPVLVLGGTVPGGSSDNATVQLANKVGAQEIYNLSNITYVYDKDPNKHKNAKPQKELDWNGFLRIVGTKRVPGGNYPFDPVAAKAAKKYGMKVSLLNGKRLSEVKKAIEGKGFVGTVISG
jgi:uridylate kinase